MYLHQLKHDDVHYTCSCHLVLHIQKSLKNIVGDRVDQPATT